MNETNPYPEGACQVASTFKSDHHNPYPLNLQHTFGESVGPTGLQILSVEEQTLLVK